MVYVNRFKGHTCPEVRMAAPISSIELLNRAQMRPRDSVSGRDRIETAVMVDGGAAIIPIMGSLESRQGFRPGYDVLGATVKAALSANNVSEIFLWVDSPGGDASGVQDLAELIYRGRAIKPITALVDDLALSAAYWIASAAHRVLVPTEGMVGSIGVYIQHTDFSAALEQAGVTVTEIVAGARKADGSPFKPLGKDARDWFQQRTDVTYRPFVESVARNRGLSVKAVREQEARIYTGTEAVHIGLADEVFAFFEQSQRPAARR